MQTNFPPLKRQKHGIDLVRKCLYCDAQQVQGGTCSHTNLTNGQHLSMEYQQLQAATEDPSFDMNDIERRLRKLEAQLTLRLKGEGNTEQDRRQHSSDSNDNNDSPTNSTHQYNQNHQANDPMISLTSTGISIATNVTESHHFFKHLFSGINPTFVRKKAAQVYSRCIDLAVPPYDNTINSQGISILTMDEESHAEQVWFDLILTTRYAKCFLVYQMVEDDRLVEWVSPAYINNLKGQVKLEHSLLSKSVRAFVYRHEKFSSHHAVSGDQGPALGQQQQYGVKLNRDIFFFQQAEELLELCYMSSSRNTIRALLHMYMYQVMTPGGYTKAVHYSDLALRMAHALKLDTDTNGMLVNEQLREDDRRLWWSTVWVHLWSCTVLNRPFMVEISTIMGPRGRVPSKRQDESSQVGYCIDFCVHSVKLILLSKSVGQRLKMKTTEAKLLWELQDIEHQLHTWSLALPEALQPRFWPNGGNRTPHSEHMDEIDQHDHPHTQSMHLFAVEIGLLLHGQWARIKMQVYECFWTNDGSILDLLVARDRLQVATNYVTHFIQAINQLQPCIHMIVLTLTDPSVSALLTLVTYAHNPWVVEQAERHLVALKSSLQTHPFNRVATVQKWIFDIDQVLAKHGLPLMQPLQQRQSGGSLDRLMITKGSISSSREAIPTQLQNYRYYLHQHPTDLNQTMINVDNNNNNNNAYPLNDSSTLFAVPTPSAATTTTTTVMLSDQEMQQYQAYESGTRGKSTLMDVVDSNKMHPVNVQPTQIQHLSSDQYVRQSNINRASVPTRSTYILPYHSNNTAMTTFAKPEISPSMSSQANTYGLYRQQEQQEQQQGQEQEREQQPEQQFEHQQQQQQQQQCQPQWSLLRDEDHHPSGKLSSESSPNLPPTSLPPRLDPDQHPFFPYQSTFQRDRHPYN